VIQPEPGRHVHYIPAAGDGGLRAGEPHAAIVTFAHSDRVVNLTVFDTNGVPVPKTSVKLQQPEDETPVGVNYCRWMPYTVKSQAEKAA
jgi:hypothetical protein